MSLHFLLKAEARTLSLRQVFDMSEDEALDFFRRLRWGNGEEVTCPECGTVRKHYYLRTRQQWRCRDCNHTFSVTSGTKFAYHKRPIKDYLAAIALFANGVKGLSAMNLARDMDGQHKAAFVVLHKVREAIEEIMDMTPVSGDVHVDGAYFGGHVRPENKKEDRKDRRLAENQNPAKRCVLVIRENYTREEQKKGFKGAKRTLAMVIEKESQASMKKLAPLHIVPGSKVSADESDAYDPMHAKYDMRRVNHSVEYRSADGTTNNMAESYFSRLRRMQVGQYHRFSAMHLHAYAVEAAFREDRRRVSNGAMFMEIVMACAQTKVSRQWCGYWQGNHRTVERLAA
jgi:transposase-like protein